MNFNELTDQQLCLLVARHEYPKIEDWYPYRSSIVGHYPPNSGYPDVTALPAYVTIDHGLSSRLWEKYRFEYTDWLQKCGHTYNESVLRAGNIFMQHEIPRAIIVALCSMWYAGKEDEVKSILEKIDD